MAISMLIAPESNKMDQIYIYISNGSNLYIFVLRWANICIMKLFDVKFEKPVVENIFFYKSIF